MSVVTNDCGGRFPVVLVVLLFAVSGSAMAQASLFTGRSGDYGLSVAAWFSGPVSLDDYGVDFHKELGVLFHGFADFYLIDKLAMGIYANYAPVSFKESDQSATLYEFGCSIKPRFLIGGGSVAIKPGLEIGYRGESTSISGIESIQAMALNGSVEVQFTAGNEIVPFGVVGFLSQPVGGNSDTGVTYAPIFYIGAGIAF